MTDLHIFEYAIGETGWFVPLQIFEPENQPQTGPFIAFPSWNSQIYTTLNTYP